MPTFVYRGDDREYPHLDADARHPVSGQAYQLDADPGDGRWKKKTTSSTSEGGK